MTPFMIILAAYLLLSTVYHFVKSGYELAINEKYSFTGYLIGGIISFIFFLGILLGW